MTRQPPLVHQHRWVTYETQYPHDSRMCLDCPAREQVPDQGADRLKEIMDVVHAQPGQHRVRGRRGRGRLNAGPSGTLLADIFTTAPRGEDQEGHAVWVDEYDPEGSTATGRTRYRTAAAAAERLAAIASAYHEGRRERQKGQETEG